MQPTATTKYNMLAGVETADDADDEDYYYYYAVDEGFAILM